MTTESTTPAPLGASDVYLDRAQVARILGSSERTISRLVQRGELPCLQVGRQMRFDLADVRAALRRKMSRTHRGKSGENNPNQPQKNQPTENPLDSTP